MYDKSQLNMKKIIFLLICLLSNIAANCQNYIPMPLTNNTIWYGTYFNINGTCGCNASMQYTVVGDSVVNSLNYKLITGGYGFCSCGTTVSSTQGLVREDTLAKKIYIIPLGINTEQVLYDFAQNVGDSVNSILTDGCNSIIQSIDSILIFGVYHKKFNITECGQGTSFIEGIGNTEGFLSFTYSFEFGGNLSCVFQNDTLIFGSANNCLLGINKSEVKNEVFVTPNPVQNLCSINASISLINPHLKLYNITGVMLLNLNSSINNTFTLDLSEIEAGIYFVEVSDHQQKILTKVVKSH